MLVRLVRVVWRLGRSCWDGIVGNLTMCIGWEVGLAMRPYLLMRIDANRGTARLNRLNKLTALTNLGIGG